MKYKYIYIYIDFVSFALFYCLNFYQLNNMYIILKNILKLTISIVN